MRAKGKLVIAITHDEGYDDVANQTLHFRDGRLTSVELESA
jgi:ABC-type siderophore export system fused ATPase/permease subunit